MKRNENYATEVTKAGNTQSDTQKNFHVGMQFFVQNCSVNLECVLRSSPKFFRIVMENGLWKIFRKTIIFNSLICTCTCVYQGVRNLSFRKILLRS